MSAERGGGAADLIARLARRWWLVAGCAMVAAIGGFVYCRIATKVYAATCVLAAEFPAAAAVSAAAAPGLVGQTPPDDFLFHQRTLIQSPPVLVAAAQAAGVPTITPGDDGLVVAVAKGEGLIAVRAHALKADEAARVANAVTEQYMKTSGGRQSAATSGLTALSRQRDAAAADRAAVEKSLHDLRQTPGSGATSADAALAARSEQLAAAFAAAQAEAAQLDAAAASAKAVAGDPEKLKRLVEANRGTGMFDALDAQRAKLQADLAQLEPQYARQKATMLPQHPVLIATRQKVESAQQKLADFDGQYGSVYVAHVEQQRQRAHTKVQELAPLIAEQRKRAADAAAGAAQAVKLEAELKNADATLAEIDGKIRDATIGVAGTGASGIAAAPVMRIVQPAKPPRHAIRPSRDTIVLGCATVGLAVGLLLAAVAPSSRRAGSTTTENEFALATR